MKSPSSQTDTPTPISDYRRIFEIVAVLLTGVGKFIFMDFLQWKLAFILTAMAGWSIYIIIRQNQVRGILPYWGFRTDNLKTVVRIVLPFGLASVIAFFLVGYQQGTLNLSWHIIPILILYPIWGTIQQFLMIGLVAGNFQDLKKFSVNKITIIFFTALLFAGVHYPNYWLIAGTFLLALFYGYVYLRARNVYALGLFHGWLGGLFYYTVVNRDPFQEVFGKLL